MHFPPFVASGRVLRVLGVYKTLDIHIRPSEFIGIEDEYTAFCFDEACAFIIAQLKDGKEPIVSLGSPDEATKATRPSDVYKKYS